MSRKRIIILTCAATCLMVAVWVYFSVDPASSRLFPRCLFLEVTGYKCPGCGSQRAIHALLNGDVASAWRMNAMLVASLPLLVLLLVAEVVRKKHAAFYARVNSGGVIMVMGVLIIAWWITRNIFNW